MGAFSKTFSLGGLGSQGSLLNLLWALFSEPEDGAQVIFVSEIEDGEQVIFELEMEDR